MAKISSHIYKSYKEGQIQKYKEILPIIQSHFRKKHISILDIGIGPGWFEDFLVKNNIKLEAVWGIEPDKNMLFDRKKYIKYFIGSFEEFDTSKQFDLVVTIDSAHLLKNPEKLFKYVKENGLVIISVPLRFKQVIENIRPKPNIEKEIGVKERDILYIFMN